MVEEGEEFGGAREGWVEGEDGFDQVRRGEVLAVERKEENEYTYSFSFICMRFVGESQGGDERRTSG